MPGNDAEHATVSVALPPAVDDWIDRQAARRDESRDAVCRQLLAAAHAVATDDELSEPVDRSELQDLRGDVDAQREEFRELLEDVRSRVIQVKREADDRAPADHDHDGYAEATDLAALATRLDRTESELEALEERTAAGFDNFETVVEDLLDETDRLDDRTRALSRALLDLREAADERTDRERERSEASALKLAANRLGVRRADCQDCGSTVEIALLSRPTCPHCASTFADVSRGRRLVGSHELVTGEPPALEGAPGTPPDPDRSSRDEQTEDR